jgi:hypothetical protein
MFLVFVVLLVYVLKGKQKRKRKKVIVYISHWMAIVIMHDHVLIILDNSYLYCFMFIMRAFMGGVKLLTFGLVYL